MKEDSMTESATALTEAAEGRSGSIGDSYSLFQQPWWLDAVAPKDFAPVWRKGKAE